MSATPSLPRILINLAAFQAGWFACVLGGAHQLPWLGVGVVALVAALHLTTTPNRGSEARLLVLIAVMGALWDGLLARFGFLIYPSGMLLPWLAPVWIIAIWVAFATTLNVSLAWLQGRWYLAFTIGALGAPLAYYAGAKLGGVHFPDPVVALAVLGGGWSFLMPASLAIAARFARTAAERDTPAGPINSEGADA
ncbi:DUF2878 domain-containing protein [Marichromatium gracile]|uniref:DUF2878 domain-containing protein n=1 Tax=Marichromatium gracile TaxID=1048 RepID=UPI001F464A4C|nr:DUF2878 domain-containing protein [Marichromatium gracile]MCF1182567.1 DUF2878 domain-containing protein [Marichromatium gracile]